MDKPKVSFLVFCCSVWAHWEAYFGTTFAVVLAVAQYLILEFGDPDKIPKWVKDFPPSLWLGIGALLFFWSCYAAWREKSQALVEAEEKLEERRPRIAFGVTNATRSELRSLENVIPPPVFHLQHYGGDGARFVKVGPILSPGGNRLEFDVINLVTSPVRVTLPFRVCGRRGEAIGQAESMNVLLHFFLKDNPNNHRKIIYDVVLEFQWKDEVLKELSKMEYDTEEMKLTVLANERLSSLD